jgi:hypothetical protein
MWLQALVLLGFWAGRRQRNHWRAGSKEINQYNQNVTSRKTLKNALQVNVRRGLAQRAPKKVMTALAAVAIAAT